MIIIFYHECNNQNFEKKYYINENMKFDKVINTYEKNIKNICNCNNKKYYLYDLFKKNIISWINKKNFVYEKYKNFLKLININDILKNLNYSNDLKVIYILVKHYKKKCYCF